LALQPASASATTARMIGIRISRPAVQWRRGQQTRDGVFGDQVQ
jgi:hypothetical protein